LILAVVICKIEEQIPQFNEKQSTDAINSLPKNFRISRRLTVDEMGID
jgi:hypothetical protein